MASNQEVAAWLSANPSASDAEITAAANLAGVSAGQLAEVTGISESEVIGRMMDAAPAATAIVSQAKATSNPLEYVNKVISSPQTITDQKGTSYDVNTLKTLAGQLAGVADASQISGGVFGTNKGNVGFEYDKLASALGANPTTYDQVLMDAARGLYKQGITDLSQLQIKETRGDIVIQPEMVWSDGNNESGNAFAIPTGNYITYVTNPNGTRTQEYVSPDVLASAKTVVDPNTGEQKIVVPNQVTGQAWYQGDKLLNADQVTPSEEGGEAGLRLGLGETVTGEGKTGYLLDLSGGVPKFTTYGADTNLVDPGMALTAAAAIGAPYLAGAIGGATGLTGANLAAATGATIGGTTSALTGGNVVKGALLGGAGGYAGAALGGANSPTGTGVDLGTATGADLDLFYDMGPAQSGGVNLGTTTTGGTTSGKMLDYSMPTAQGGLGLQATPVLNTVSGGFATPAVGTGGLGLTASAAGNLGYMGGAQGLTANAAGGGTLSAGGVNTGLFTPDNLYNSSIGTGGTGGGTGTNITVTDVIKALPIINTAATLLGGGSGGSGGTTGTTGFNVVPVPTTWQPPATTSGGSTVGKFTPIDLNSIFTNQNLLIGTQWEGLPNQRNLTFNDIFAAGQQKTPMGTPVNINNLVSAILGQSATS